MRELDQLVTFFSKKGYHNLCIMTTTFPPYPPEATAWSVGGATVDIVALKNILSDLGFDISVLALDFVGASKKKDPADIIRLGKYVPYSTGGISSGINFISNEFFNPFLLVKLIRILKRKKFDAIILGESFQLGLVPHIAARLFGIPLFLRYDWICPAFPEKSPCSFIYRAKNCGSCLTEKKGLRLSPYSQLFFGLFSSMIFLAKINIWRYGKGAILAVNDFYKDYYLSYNIANEKIFVLPPNRSKISTPLSMNKRSPLVDTSFTLLFVGRLSREKGVLLLLNSYRLLSEVSPKIKLIIAGDGPLRREVEDFSKTYSKSVTYMGWVEGEKLSELYLNCSVVVIPSIVPEGHPIVADEAIQFQKMIIGFGLGGLQEIFSGYSNSKKVEKISYKALADEIIKIFNSYQG